jgi:predicted ATPase/class 3 adenylate cyclase
MTLSCAACGEQNPARARFCLACGAPLADTAQSLVRRLVTVLFADLVGSTELGERLDPEATREILSRYFARTREALESHGATVEKYIGDAVMAVFGLPTRHEDDALRAVRAALAIRDTIATLNDELERDWGIRLDVRIGIHSGEVAGDPRGGIQSLVTGDPVNTAARLQQAAEPREIVVSAASHALMRGRVAAVPLAPLRLKGKGSAVEALRVVGLASSAEVVVHRTPFVGRADELAGLRAALTTVVAQRQCLVRLVVGPPGIGKSRLVAEFAAGLNGDARVLHGDCLAYGAGITFWPIAEVIRQVTGITRDDRPDLARSKLQSAVAQMPDGADLEATLAAVIGLEAASPPQPIVARAIGMFLESLARNTPVVIVIEDIHWAEPALLDLLEYVERRARAPLLILCPARPELFEARPEWQRDGRAIALEPLAGGETGMILDGIARGAPLAASIRDRITNTAAGNPLFAEQLLAMLLDRGFLVLRDGRWNPAGSLESMPLPPTIDALLSARLEHLGVVERQVLEHAAAVGTTVSRDLLRAILPGDLRRRLPTVLRALTSHAFLRVTPASGDDVLEFVHVLLRDAVYAGTTKRERHRLHELVGGHLEAMAGERLLEIEELIGYHLEQASRLRRELRSGDAEAARLADRAARHLAAAGRRAFGRGDMPAVRNLLGRAVDLLPPDAPERVELLPSLGKALIEVGELPAARTTLDEAIDRGSDLGLDQTVAYARIHRAVLRIWSEDAPIDEAFERREIERAIAAFEAGDDHRGIAQAWSLLAELEWSMARQGPANEAIQQAVTHAELAGDDWLRSEYLALSFSDPGMAANLEAAADACLRVLDSAPGDHVVAARTLPMLGLIRAAQGDADTSRRLYRQGLEYCRELGLRIWEGEMCALAGWTELLNGDPDTAERVLKEGHEVLVRMGDRMHLSFVAALLARALELQGRVDEALASVRLSRSTETASTGTWEAVYARLLARNGDPSALDFARRTVEQARGMGDWYYADALVDLAEAHVRLGRAGEARSLLRRADRIYRRMGNVAGRRQVAEVSGAATSPLVR